MVVRQSDVARYAGVSARTVSNVVNGYVHVSPEVRAKVQAAIDALGYQRSAAARGLRLGRTGLIALGVPSLRERYFADLAEAVVHEAERHELTVMVEVTGGRRERERLVLGGGRSSLTDGALLSAIELTAADARLAAGTAYPLVLIGDRRLDGPFDHVAIPNVAGARAATGHLVALGKRRVVLLGDAAANKSGRLRREGFRKALAEAGLEAQEELAIPWTREAGRAAVDKLRRADAVFALNDSLALGVLAGCAELGVDVPGELAVVGFDDVEEAQYSTPPLTSVAPSVGQIARRGVELLAQRLADPTRTPEHVTTDFRLVVRGSTD
ncbi:LacI family DNA-binding transcriptional regulator [Kribbella sp. NPDC051770]|uniref:LacI family DNA-binding transcriptional regulator n=1 Tax=Kribbella sp. NPDC051770 TaxID=3155413 RepID=UPI0034254A81